MPRLTTLSERSSRINRDSDEPIRNKNATEWVLEANGVASRHAALIPSTAEECAHEIFQIVNEALEPDDILVGTAACNHILDILRPIFHERTTLTCRVAAQDAEILQLKGKVVALQKVVSRLNAKKRTRVNIDVSGEIWLAFKILCGCSYDDMRILRRCDNLVNNCQRNYNVPSEDFIEQKYRGLCAVVDTYLLRPSALNSEWTEGFYIDPTKFLRDVLNFHVKEMDGKFVDIDMGTHDSSNFHIIWGFDGAPMSSRESWFVGQIIFSFMNDCLGDLAARVAVVLPYPEKHPCVTAVLTDISQRLSDMQKTPYKFKLTQRTYKDFDLRFSTCVADMSFRSTILKHMSSSAIAFTSFGNVGADNLSFFCNKRGDDSTLDLLLFDRRTALATTALHHYRTVEAEAVAKHFDAKQLAAHMLVEHTNFSVQVKSGIYTYNPQLDMPLSIGRNMLMAWLHAGLRDVSAMLKKAHRLCWLLHENGFCLDPNIIACEFALLSPKGELRAVSVRLRATTCSTKIKGLGSLIGRMCDIIQRGLGVIFSRIKTACGTSSAFKLITTAMFFIAAKHRDILGVLKEHRDLTDADIDFILDCGKEAFNVWFVFFNSSKAHPYQIAIEFECGALLKAYVRNTGNYKIWRLSDQHVERGNKKVKTTARKGNFVSNPSLVGVKMGPEFKSHWREKTFQPFMADHVRCTTALKYDIFTPGQVDSERRDTSADLLIRPATGSCHVCGCVPLMLNAACVSVICEKKFMDIVREGARDCKLSHAGEVMFASFNAELHQSLRKEADASESSSGDEQDDAPLVPGSAMPAPHPEGKRKRKPKLATAAAPRKPVKKSGTGKAGDLMQCGNGRGGGQRGGTGGGRGGGRGGGGRSLRGGRAV